MKYLLVHFMLYQNLLRRWKTCCAGGWWAIVDDVRTILHATGYLYTGFKLELLTVRPRTEFFSLLHEVTIAKMA